MGQFFKNSNCLKARLEAEEEAILVARLAARDGAALGELYDRFGKVMFAIVCRITGDQGVAEDLVQEVFLRIWSNPSLYQVEKGTLFGWITAVSRNRAIDYLRSTEGRISQSRADLSSLRFAVPSHEACVSRDYHFSSSLEKAVEALTPNQREVIRLAYYEGMSQTEMAMQMNQPLGTVKSWTRTALAALRRDVAPFQTASIASFPA